MNKRLIALVAGLTLCASVSVFAQPKPAAPAAAPELKVVSFTGTIQIKSPDGKTITVEPGKPVPPIPAGSQIEVKSGQAVFQSGNTAISAKAGEGFSFNATPAGAGAPPAVQIAATGDKTELKVTVGKTEAVLSKGDAVSVVSAGTGAGAGTMQVTAGEVSVTSGGQTTTVAKGQTVAAAPATPAAPAAPAPKAPAAPATPATPAAPVTGTVSAPTETAPVETAPIVTELPPPPPPPNPLQDTAVTNTCDPTVSPSAPGCP